MQSSGNTNNFGKLKAALRSAETLYQAVNLLNGPVVSDEERIFQLAGAIVPEIADWCAIDLFENKQIVRRRMMGNALGKGKVLAQEINAYYGERPFRWLGDLTKSFPRKAILFSEISDPALKYVSLDRREFKIFKKMKFSCAIIAPLVAPSGLIGSLTLFGDSADRNFCQNDLFLVEELAERAAIALENARLFGELKNAVRIRGDVLSLVAHELRSPLTSITLSADLIQAFQTSSDSAASKSVDNIRKSAKQMNRLVGDLLDLSKLETARFSVKLKDTVISSIAADILLQAKTLAETKKLRLTMAIEDPDLVIQADEARINQVLLNLVSNAVKFTPNGGTLKISQKLRDDRALFCVSDSGPGIAPDKLPYVFDRFWQAESTKSMGSGLGLSIAKGIVEAHRGTIWAKSELGVGSSFYFTIPVK